MGLLQSKWHPKGITLTLHGTHCVHTSMNVRKMKFISCIYTLFLHLFCSLFANFWCKFCIYVAKRSYKPTYLVIMFSGWSRGGSWVQTNPLLSLNYFIFMVNFREKLVKLHKSNPPHLIWTPDSKILDPPLTFNSHLHDVMSIKHLFYLSMTSHTHNVMWMIVAHQCMNLIGPK